jgi:hypothetical protein
MAANDRNAQPFSTQSGGQQRKTIGKFVEAFEAAGNDVAGLLAHFLESSPVGIKNQVEARQSIREALRESAVEAEKSLDQLLEAVRDLHTAKTTKDRERLRIMSLLAPIFTRADLIRRGFRVSNDAFANARKHATNVGPGAPVNHGGRPRLYTPELAMTLDHFCCDPEISYVNPNFVVAQQSLDPQTQLLLEGEEMVAVHDLHGNPVAIPLRATIVGENGKEIPNRVLKVSVSILHSKFTAAHPELKLSAQGLRTLLPKNLIRRSRDNDPPNDTGEDDYEPVIHELTPNKHLAKGKRSRQIKSQSQSSSEHQVGSSPSVTGMEVVHQQHAVGHHGETDDMNVEQEIVSHHLVAPSGEYEHDMSQQQHIHHEDENIIDPEDGAPPRKRSKIIEEKK